jgi:TolB protein
VRELVLISTVICAIALVASPTPSGGHVTTARQTRSDGARRVAIEGLGGSLQNPCWSPSDDRLAITQFKRGYNDGLSVVWTVPSSGGQSLVMLSTDDAESVSMPGSCWNTPDDLVAYTADPVGPDQIYVVPSEGGKRRRVTEPPQVAWEPTFSPDGEWLVFESHKKGPKGEIWKVRSDGSELTRLTSGSNDRQPNWSPAGDLIVFQRHRKGQVDVWLMDTNGDNLKNVTRTRSREETDVSFAPSGDYLVFSGDGKGVDFASLFTIATDGTGPTTVRPGGPGTEHGSRSSPIAEIPTAHQGRRSG